MYTYIHIHIFIYTHMISSRPNSWFHLRLWFIWVKSVVLFEVLILRELNHCQFHIEYYIQFTINSVYCTVSMCV